MLSSSIAGGMQALFGFDPAAGVWQQIGGSGMPMDLNGGAIIYPKNFFYPGEAPTDLTQTVPQPSVVGDTLWCQEAAGYPLQVAVSKDGATWSHNHPHRFTPN